jgi:hypothetical protein
MNKFFARNLSTTGRIVRACIGLGLVIAGLVISAPNRWICTCMVISGGFVLYEAARGWCVMRACGIKTRF